MSDFKSMLSVFQDATGGRSNAAAARGVGQRQSQNNVVGAAAAGSIKSNNDEETQPLDPTSTTDPSFTAPVLKQRIERVLKIQQIRQSTVVSSSKSNAQDAFANDVRTDVHIAICSVIVDQFPHEPLWKKWMEETGGIFSVDAVNSEVSAAKSNSTSANEDEKNCTKEDQKDGAGKGTTEGKTDKEQNDNKPKNKFYTAHAELYIHAKNPEHIQSQWVKSKTIPITHRPNWNDVRIIRAILSLIEAALKKNEQTTHILLCTESCIPVATLKEVARSVLLDEVCPWEEKAEEGELDIGDKIGELNSHWQREVDWNRSYVDCYGRSSSRCTRFDEHNCWGILKDSVPAETIYKALPGWCILSRKHAQSILDIPSRLEGCNLWPAFERVWAPEEVFIPTALAIGGHMTDGSNEVIRRALTHSQWDERAANHKDRAHPLSYDGYFDDGLVSRVRSNGCMFMRKMKSLVNVALWEQIVVQRRKGRQEEANAEERAGSGHDQARRGRDWENDRGRGGARYLDSRGGRHNGSYHNNRSGYDSRSNNYGRRQGDDHHRHKRGRDDRSSYHDRSHRRRY